MSSLNPSEPKLNSTVYGLCVSLYVCFYSFVNNFVLVTNTGMLLQNHDVTDSDAEILSILIELFIEKTTQWLQVIHAINHIDVLRSFAVIANFSCGAMSRPVILPHSEPATLSGETRGPLLKIRGLWHPFAIGENGGLPVPNDIHLGEDTDGNHPRTLLLTGPNMGGKSTLLRATCLAVILAQVSFVVWNLDYHNG